MKKWLSLLTTLCSLLSGSLSGAKTADSFSVIVLGEEQGYLEPCGCTPGMLGGIARRQTALAQIEAAHPNALVLHNGGLLTQFGRQAELKRAVQVQDLNALGVAVLGLAPSDLILGIDSLRQFQKQAAFPIVASNLIDTKKRITFAEEESHKKFRFFSLMSETYQPEIDRYLDGMRIEPIQEKINEWRDEKNENEFWVLLFHAPILEAQELSLKTDLFDLIVYNMQGELPFFQRMKSVNMLSIGEKGRYFIVADFESTPPFNLIDTQRITLDQEYSAAPYGIQLIANYKLQLKEEKIAEKYPKVAWPQEATYVGSQQCALCHQAEYNVWKDSKHAHALDNLIPENNHFDPECLQCHTTGFSFQGGFKNLNESKALGNVSCETCHGPRSLHVQNPRTFQNPTPTRATCLQCHDPENSPTFDFDTYWPKIKH